MSRMPFVMPNNCDTNFARLFSEQKMIRKFLKIRPTKSFFSKMKVFWVSGRNGNAFEQLVPKFIRESA